MTEIFRARVDSKVLNEAKKIADEIGTTPADIVRLLFKQMVKRRTIPFPLNADSPEDEAVGPAKRRAELARMFD